MTKRCRPVGRRAGLVGLATGALIAIVTGCSIEQTMPAPSCASGGSNLIVAQSVPSASRVPCLETLPDGWSVTSVSVNQDRSIITLDSDRAGAGAATLRLVPACDVSAAVPATSEYSESERFEHIKQLAPGFTASRFYRFAGGCVTWDFQFDDDASATEAVALGEALRLIPRRELGDLLSESLVEEGLW
jgi:hypothetical protein